MSYALVNGACCFVWFSTVVTAGNLRGNTINIASTGAKTIAIGKHDTGNNDSNVLGAQTMKGYFFVYNGSSQYIAGGSTMYADYGD